MCDKQLNINIHFYRSNYYHLLSNLCIKYLILASICIRVEYVHIINSVGLHYHTRDIFCINYNRSLSAYVHPRIPVWILICRDSMRRMQNVSTETDLNLVENNRIIQTLSNSDICQKDNLVAICNQYLSE